MRRCQEAPVVPNLRFGIRSDWIPYRARNEDVFLLLSLVSPARCLVAPVSPRVERVFQIPTWVSHYETMNHVPDSVEIKNDSYPLQSGLAFLDRVIGSFNYTGAKVASGCEWTSVHSWLNSQIVIYIRLCQKWPVACEPGVLGGCILINMMLIDQWIALSKTSIWLYSVPQPTLAPLGPAVLQSLMLGVSNMKKPIPPTLWPHAESRDLATSSIREAR